MASSPSRPVVLVPATRADAPVLANLLELYVHDLSEMFEVAIGADGRFGYEQLPRYWDEPETHRAFLIRAEDRLAGFALVTRGSPATSDSAVLDLAEFFVLRAHRRGGVGRRAAFALWNSLPGRWVVRVSEANHGGLRFWEPTIREYTGGAFTESERPGRLHPFRVYSFTSREARQEGERT